MLRNILSFVALLMAADLFAAATNSPTSADSETAYREVIEKRVADIIAPLNLRDAGKMRNVHDVLVAQYRTLRDWHDANDVKRKAAKGSELEQINASLKAIHEKFLSQLSTELTPQQVDIVKDKMTYNKVKVTYDAYCEIIPTLTDAQKEKILETLKGAREEAMDGGSSDEKSAIFKKYKGRIANYLAKEGVNEQKARKEWGEKQKAMATTNSTSTKPESASPAAQ